MKKRIAAGRREKRIIDAAMGLLYLLLLGYAFTGGKLHEIAGILFMVIAVLHNIVNAKWYRTWGKGRYDKRRRLTTGINIALLADMAAILLTGVLNSRFLFPTGLRLTGIGQLHKIFAMIGFVLIVAHIAVHLSAKNKKLPVILTISACVLALVLDLFLLPYLKRHFLTVEIDRAAVISGEEVALEDRKILTVYFTRVGNTDFADGVDAVSGASLLLDEEGNLLGNSQVIGLMIQDAAGGDILSINTRKMYPSSYSATVSAAGDEMKLDDLPELVNMPENIDGYDTVFLVYPLWWYTIPKPVEAFLRNYDFSGKTVIPVVTHGGSGAGKSVEAIRAACGGTVTDDILEIYCDDIPYCRERVAQWLKEQ